MLTREQIEAVALETRVVTVREWGGDVLVSELSGADRDDWELAFLRRWEAEERAAKRESRPFDQHRVSPYPQARLVAWTLRGQDGAPLFLVRTADGRVDLDATEAAARVLAARSGRAVGRVYPIAESLNLTSPGALEVAEGNSGGTPGASPSAKPA